MLINSPPTQNYVLSTASANELCILTGGTAPTIQGYVSYAQL
jgi:hypothetical protein